MSYNPLYACIEGDIDTRVAHSLLGKAQDGQSYAASIILPCRSDLRDRSK